MIDRRTVSLGLVALATAGSGRSEARQAWPNGARAAVSLSYDDGYDSQLENVGPALDRYGLKATFFLTVENIDERLADWQKLISTGHELGNHTNSHPCHLRSFTMEEFEKKELQPSEEYFTQHFGGPSLRTFAYPCGAQALGRGPRESCDARYQSVLRARFLAARTVSGAPNAPAAVIKNRYQLNGFEPTYDYDTPGLAAAYVERAIQHGHWAILIFHEVVRRKRKEGDTTIPIHNQILENVARAPIWCAPVRTVFNHIVARTQI